MKFYLIIMVPVLVAWNFAASAFTGEIIQSFSTPGQYPTGMAFDGQNIWIADRKTDLLYLVSPADGKVIRSIPSPGYWPSGLAWDGTNLWCSDIKGGQDVEELYEGVIYKLDPKDGTVLQTMPAPSKYPVDLAWDGHYLWCVDNSSDELIQFSPNDGTTIRSFKSPAWECQGLEFDGLYLWVSSSSLNEIYMVMPDDGTVLLVMASPGPVAAGLCYDGKCLWNADYQDDLLYQLTIRDEEKFVRKNERKSRLVYTHQIKNFGPGNLLTADVHLAVPVNRDNQDVLDISYNIRPDEMVTDRWGQVTAHYHETGIKPGETRILEMITRANTYDVTYFIFPEEVGTLDDIPEDIKSKYLEDNEKFQMTHPVIQDAVKTAVGEEKNPFWISRRIFNYIISKMYYEMTGGWNTAPTVLARGNGSCSEYTFVFISMCRAAGVPARYVGSVAERGEAASMDDVFHRWVEVYLPNYGWIPVDPSGGDSDWPRNQAMAIGHLSRRFLITTESGGGSETMEWTYNSNRFFTTEPKTLVNFEHFGDWEVIK